MPQQHVAYLIVSIAATVQGEQTFEPPSTRKELKGLCHKLYCVIFFTNEDSHIISVCVVCVLAFCSVGFRSTGCFARNDSTGSKRMI